MTPPPDWRDPHVEREHFEDVLSRRGALYWAERTVAGKRRRDRRAEMLIAAARAAARAQPRRLLEIGCGTGAFTRALTPLTSGRLVGVDVAPELVMRAHAAAVDAVRVVSADVEALPFAAGAFDAVVGNAVLHHLRLARALPELLRVLRPGGAFCFTEPNMLNPQVFLERNVRWIGERLDNSPGETAFVRWRLARLLRQAGIVDVRTRPFDFLYPLTPKPLIRVVERLGRLLEHTPLVAEIAGSLLVTGRKPEAGRP